MLYSWRIFFTLGEDALAIIDVLRFFLADFTLALTILLISIALVVFAYQCATL